MKLGDRITARSLKKENDVTQHQPFLKGKLVFLRSVEQSDISAIVVWINGPEVTHYMFYGQLPTNLEQVETFIMDQVRSPKNAVFAVCDLKKLSLIFTKE